MTHDQRHDTTLTLVAFLNVQVKKIVDGTIGDCTYIEGLACSKNVAHKKMKAKVQNPRILLLSSSLEFQRTARFSSFDALLQQEKQHLQIVVNKIAALKPDVVVVEKTVSRLALEFLLKVTVVFELSSVVGALSRDGTPRRVSHYRPTSRSS